MSADDERLADFTEFAALMATTQGLEMHFVKDALATALGALSEFDHGLIMALGNKSGQLPFRTGVLGAQAALFLRWCLPCALLAQAVK